MVAGSVDSHGRSSEIKIFVMSPVTSNDGYEYQFVLSKLRVNTDSAHTIENANYLIVENNTDVSLETTRDEFLLLSHIPLNDTSDVVKSIDIYKKFASSM